MRLRRTSLLLLILSWLLLLAPPMAAAKAPKPTTAVASLRKGASKTVRDVSKSIQAAATLLGKQLKGLGKDVTKGTIAPAAAVATATDHLVVYFDTTLDDVREGTDSVIAHYESLCDSAGASDPVCKDLNLSAGGAGVTLHNGNQTNLDAIRAGARDAWAPFGLAMECVGESVHFDSPGPARTIPPHVIAAERRGEVDAEFAQLSEFLANITTCTGTLTIVLREGYRSSSGNLFVYDDENKIVRVIPLPAIPSSTTTTIEVGGLPAGTYLFNDYNGSGNGGSATVEAWESAPPPPTCPATPELTFTLNGQNVTTPPVASVAIRVDDATGRISSVFFRTTSGLFPSFSWSSSDETPGTDDPTLSAATPAVVTLGSTLAFYRADAATSATSTSTGTFKILGLANVVNNPSGCVSFCWDGGQFPAGPATAKLVIPVANIVVTRD